MDQSEISIPFDRKYYFINYEIESSFGDMEGLEYINEVVGKIIATNGELGENKIVEDVGIVKVKVFLIDKAIDEQGNLLSLFDNPNFGWIEGQELFDFETGEYRDDFLKRIPGEYLYGNICYIDYFALLPEYRGKGLGKQILKDVYTRFTSGCTMLVIDIHPLQHYGGANHPEGWEEKLKLDLLDDNLERAMDNLHSYFLAMGFEKLQDSSMRFNMLHLNNVLFDSIQRE